MRVLVLCLSLVSGAALALEPAPALVAPTLDGRQFDLAALKGHPVIVNFWATWCVPCRAEMPMLSAFYLRHKGEGVEMIGVSVDAPRDLPGVKKLAATVSYPVAVARDASKNGFPAVNELPVTYVIDATGMVRARLTPAAEGLKEDDLLRALR